jgi:dTDP-3-amino-3,4,6-trideoxy-alpha-D-glucose transaminase
MILLNDFQRQWRDTEDAVMQAVRSIGANGWYVLGAEVRAFETNIAAYWSFSEAVGVASGLDAIEIALRVLGIKPGDQVLTTPVSAFATTLAILKLGATPVFVDVDRYGMIDLAACREVLARRPEIRFLLPVHLYGHALDLDALESLRRDFGCLVVEDCAQSIGAMFRGRKTGSAGDIAVTSFYPTKNLGALGDGGAILTNSPQFAAAARTLRDYGQCAKYRHSEIGYNSRLDELQAGIMRQAYLPRLDGWTERRRAVASRYLEGLDHPSIQVPGAPEHSESCWHLFPVLTPADRKQDFMAYMKQQSVLCGEHYPIVIPHQPAMSQAHFEMESDCAAAIGWCAREVSLPIHPYLEDAEVERVIEVANAWPG